MGAVISPLIANVALSALDEHFAQAWQTTMTTRVERAKIRRRGGATYRLVRYADERKTRVVYCKDDDRRGSYEHTSFDFLSYTFRPRLSKNRFGKHFVNFSPAVSSETKTRLRREMRRWGVARRSDKTLTDLALMFNRQLQGWINYYGKFYKSMLYPVFRHLNDTLVRWAMRKYKRLRRRPRRARRFLADVARRQPGLFAHWRFGVRPDGWTMGAR